MARRRILTEGDPALRRKARPVHTFDERLRVLAGDMLETMRHANGIGLAAPQVGVLKRLFVMNTGDGDLVVVNPVLDDPEGEQESLEGCLSLPDLYGYVKRPSAVTLKGMTLTGDPFERRLEGLAAVCACHETDHLNGVLFRDVASGTLHPTSYWDEANGSDNA